MKNLENWKEKFRASLKDRSIRGLDITPPLQKIDWAWVILEKFIEDALQAQRKELVEKLEGLKIKDPICYCKSHPEHNCDVTSNAAIVDAISIISSDNQ